MLIVLIILQVLSAISLPFWFMSAMMSFMSFDSGITTGATAFVIAIWSYPLWVILGSIMGWVMYNREKMTLAMVWMSLPFIILVLAAIVFVILVNSPSTK